MLDPSLNVQTMLTFAGDGTKSGGEEEKSDGATQQKTKVFRMVCVSDFLIVEANTVHVLEVLESFLYDEEIYRFLIEVAFLKAWRHSSLASLLLDTYGNTPTRLLHMWRWAESSGAFSACERRFGSYYSHPESSGAFSECERQIGSDCPHPASKARHYYCKKYVDELVTSKAYSWYQEGNIGAESVAELDPSLTSFNEKLWIDVRDGFKNGEFSYLSRFSTVFLRIIRHLLHVIYSMAT